MNCPLCGKPVENYGRYPGNPVITHMACALKAINKSREHAQKLTRKK